MLCKIASQFVSLLAYINSPDKKNRLLLLLIFFNRLLQVTFIKKCFTASIKVLIMKEEYLVFVFLILLINVRRSSVLEDAEFTSKTKTRIL